MLRNEPSLFVNVLQRKNSLALLLGAIFMIVVALLIIGSYSNRLAQVHEDNGAVFYTYLYGHSSQFVRDPFGKAGIALLWGSVCFWGPVLAHKYLGLDPRVPDYGFFLAQIFLLGFSVLVYTWQVSRSWLSAFASMGLALVVQPWSWNFAAYGGVIDLPLYTTLAMALGVLAGAAFLAEQWNVAWALALVTAIVHPVIACYIFVMLVSWAWINRAGWRRWMTLPVLAKLGVLVALCGTPLLIHFGFTEALLTPKEHWESVSKHMHSVPWGNTAYFRIFGFRVIGFMIVFACCWPSLRTLPQNQRRFLFACATGTMLLGLIQILGVEFKIAEAALTMGLRAFSILVLFAWPFAFTFIFSREVLGRFETSFTLLILTCVWYRLEGGIPAFNLFLFALAMFWPRWFAPQRRHVYGPILAALPLVFILSDHQRWIFWGPQGDVSALYYIAALLVSAVVADLLTVESAIAPLRRLTAFGLLVFALVRAQLLGAQTYDPAITALREAELWARDHTPPGTIFMTNEGWRTISERPAAMLGPDLTEEIYTPYRSIRERNEFLFRLYGLGDTWRNMSIANINIGSAEGYRRLQDMDFSALARAFGAPYLVRAKNEPVLHFPVVHENGGYRIYLVAN